MLHCYLIVSYLHNTVDNDEIYILMKELKRWLKKIEEKTIYVLDNYSLKGDLCHGAN